MKKRIILGLTCGLILLIGGSIILKNFNKDNSVMVSSNNDININDVNKEYYNEISANSEFINEEKEENNSNNSEDIMENTNNNTVISISNEDFNANSDTIANNKKEELNLNDDTTTNNKREELSQTSDNSTNYTKDNTNDMIWNKENNEFENTEIEATISVNTKKIRIEKGTSQDVYVSCYPEATDFLQVGGMSKNTNIAHCTGILKI